MGLGQEFANIKAKYSGTPHWNGMQQPFRQSFWQYLTVWSCLRKGLAKEQITMCTDSQAAVAALTASGTKWLLVADCIEKLTVLAGVNQVTIMWVPGYSEIQQNETADRLVREGARTRPISSKPFLPLSLSRFKIKIKNWIKKGKRENSLWKV